MMTSLSLMISFSVSGNVACCRLNCIPYLLFQKVTLRLDGHGFRESASYGKVLNWYLKWKGNVQCIVLDSLNNKGSVVLQPLGPSTRLKVATVQVEIRVRWICAAEKNLVV